jgi:predicted Zn-dependent peptidase
LENGATLILKPVKGIGRVAIESIYDVGFVDEPKEMCQASHLLLNLVCFASTENYRDGESSELFKCLGAANGEVLPDWTHYDYIVPSDHLKLALKVETERLTSLQIDPEVASREIPQIYQQVEWLEKRPETGMLKHAFMAFSQAWRNGQDLALVRGGLESIPIEQLREFHAATYRPDRLTLVIAGDFDLEKAKQSVQETIGTVTSPKRVARRTIDWENLPQNLNVEWDASLSAVCVYYPPPAAALDRIVLSYLGTGWIDSLSNDPTLKAMTDMIIPSPVTWPVGELPFFVYAAVKPGRALDQVEQALKSHVQKLVETSSAQTLRQMQANATMIVNQLEPGTGSRFLTMVELLAKQQKMNRGRALDMVLGYSALSERTLRQLGGNAGDGGLEQLRTLQLAQLKTIVDATVKPAKQHTIRVVPKSIAR